MRPQGWTLAQALILFTLTLLNIIGNTRFTSPPRYDGAGYAILAEAYRTGQGYREISHPDAPRHTHFPPGYPIALAAVWSISGRSFAVAHLFSTGCSTLAVLCFWRWFASMYSARVAFTMGLTLALNWTWGRVGGSIQSEPLFLLLVSLVVLIAQARTTMSTLVLAIVLAVAVLTRHVGICLVVAVIVDLWMQRARRAALVVTTLVLSLLAPWGVWLAVVGRRTQVDLIPRGNLGSLIADQSLFYLRRIPDQIVGPFVEVATVFTRTPMLGMLATFGALLITALICTGWWRCLSGHEGRRLAGLVPLVTFPLLLVWPFTEAGRFLIPFLPFLLIGGVEGIEWLLTHLFSRADPGGHSPTESPLNQSPSTDSIDDDTARRMLSRPRLQAAQFLLIFSIPYAAYAILSNRVAAQERTHADFETACAFLKDQNLTPGPVMSRHPGDVFWLSGRKGLEPPADPKAIAEVLDKYQLAYLLIDEARYARAESSPLVAFVESNPSRARLVMQNSSVLVYKVITASEPGLQR